MGEWSFEHAVTTRASRTDAWAYWSDMCNHMRLEPGIERIELDGPFATGTTGRTVALGITSEWRLSDVVPQRHFATTGVTRTATGRSASRGSSVAEVGTVGSIPEKAEAGEMP
jgi:Polyketide cyclase / dehydrase and lipid transport